MSTQTQIVPAKSAEQQAISATMSKAARRPAWGLTIGALIALIAFAIWPRTQASPSPTCPSQAK